MFRYFFTIFEKFLTKFWDFSSFFLIPSLRGKYITVGEAEREPRIRRLRVYIAAQRSG